MRVWFSGPRIMGIRPGVSFSQADLARVMDPRRKRGVLEIAAVSVLKFALALVAVGLIAAAILIFYFIVTAKAASACEPNAFEFNQLKMKMTYNEVVKIIGCDGTQISESEFGGSKSSMYVWQSDEGISNMNAMFMNGKMISKAQLNLH